MSEPFAALLTTVWIGGFFFWMLKGFKGKFSDEITDGKRTRNFVTGYIIQMLALVLAIVCIIFRKN